MQDSLVAAASPDSVLPPRWNLMQSTCMVLLAHNQPLQPMYQSTKSHAQSHVSLPLIATICCLPREPTTVFALSAGAGAQSAAGGGKEENQADSSEGPDDQEVFDEDLLPASCLFYGVRGAHNALQNAHLTNSQPPGMHTSVAVQVIYCRSRPHISLRRRSTSTLACHHPCEGAQMREGEAPSYFNPVEASVVVDLVAGLLRQHERSAVGVTVSDIGVIATYRKQVGGNTYGCNSLRLFAETIACSLL